MTVLTLQAICENPPLALYEICKDFSKISETSLTHVHFHLRQNLQQAAVRICSRKFGCPSQEPWPKFKEHLLLMTAFKVYHMCRKYEEGSSKFGGLVGVLVNVWGSIVGGASKKKGNVWLVPIL